MNPIPVDLLQKRVGVFRVGLEFLLPRAAGTPSDSPLADGGFFWLEAYAGVDVLISVSRNDAGMRCRVRRIVVDSDSDARVDGRALDELSFGEVTRHLESAGVRQRTEYEAVAYLSNHTRVGVWYDHIDKIWFDDDDGALQPGPTAEIRNRQVIDLIMQGAENGT